MLRRAEIIGNALRIVEQLDRPLYVSVNKALEALGGKWDRKARAHLFSEPPANAIAKAITTEEVIRPQDEGFFPTPAVITLRMAQLAKLKPGMSILEPSAGDGAIASWLVRNIPGLRLVLVELNPSRHAILVKGGFRAICGDFIAMNPKALGRFDRVVMNPPFQGQLDLVHVKHAFEFLRPGGRLVSILAAGVDFRENRLTNEFRTWVKKLKGQILPLPPNSFKASGTAVNTAILVIDKPAPKPTSKRKAKSRRKR